MLYYKNLYGLFFDDYPKDATDFVGLTGYVGIDTIDALRNLPFRSTIIYGLFYENKRIEVHNQLLRLHNENRIILYPQILCHSKCYLWLKGDKPIKGLIGSANFSPNGLKNDYRESLLAIDNNQLFMLKGYIELIKNSTIPCVEAEIERVPTIHEDYDKDVCKMILFDPETGQTHIGHGLNWGLAEGSHVRIDDACIPIRMEHIRRYPKLFPPLTFDPERTRGSLKEVVEIIWDDGIVMQGRLEGSQPSKGNIKYPKQFASYPHKDDMGKYIRNRVGVELGERVLMEDLIRYGRVDIDVSLLEEGVYYFNFSV
jgi:hypothetical protein